ncbi:MAG: AbrB/MazE/SpoVT family DNA-binding domain-containing protein [Betaproteobacteria bacterium]|nr:AbrB/MazE/SpoVT family DNA-binding domain-containing protein [Betaproteobacteria bacterium]
MDTSTMSTKGQVVIPKKVRERLQASAGSRIGFRIAGDRVVVYVVRRKSGNVERGYGLLKGKGKAVALERWSDALKASARKRRHAGR